jgi:hypothetical protein
LVKVSPAWRGDDRVYEFLHEPTGMTLCWGSPHLRRFKKRVVELAEPQLAQLNWENLDPDDPLNYPVYRDEFYRIMRESFAKARAEKEA